MSESDLAYNVSGEAFAVPETVTAWRVRRLRGGRGAPELVYGRDGRPLTLGIEATMEDLRDAVDASGKYRLDGIDDEGRPVEGVPPAYVQVTVPERTPAEPAAPVTFNSVDHALREVVRANVDLSRFNTELARTIISQQPGIMNATAEIMRAADGAGLPARTPRVIDVADDDDEDDAAPAAPATSPTFELLNSLVAQIVPIVVTNLMGGKVPNLGAIFDWRKAAAAGASKREAREARMDAETSAPARREPVPSEPVSASSSAATAEATAGSEPSASQLPPLDPAAMAHVMAIQRALTPEEAQLARALAAELTPAEMRAWFAELSALSVPDAVAKVRAILGEGSNPGAAS